MSSRANATGATTFVPEHLALVNYTMSCHAFAACSLAVGRLQHHPHQDAIHAAGWVSLFTLHVLWPFLWIWAFSAIRAQIFAECSPIPAVNTKASRPPRARKSGSRQVVRAADNSSPKFSEAVVGHVRRERLRLRDMLADQPRHL